MKHPVLLVDIVNIDWKQNQALKAIWMVCDLMHVNLSLDIVMHVAPLLAGICETTLT